MKTTPKLTTTKILFGRTFSRTNLHLETQIFFKYKLKFKSPLQI